MSAQQNLVLQRSEHPERLLDTLLHQHALLHATYCVSSLPHAPDETTAPIFWTTYPLIWQMRYASENYWRIDPAVHVDRHSLLPVDFASFDRSSRAVRHFFGEAEDFGVGRHGLVAPVRGPRGERGILSVTSDCSDADWAARRPRLMRELIVSAHEIHAAAMSQIGGEPAAKPPHLAPRETECLQWSAAGKTVDEIAVILGLNRRNVRAQLDSARARLHASNIAHAVSRAIALGLISPV